ASAAWMLCTLPPSLEKPRAGPRSVPLLPVGLAHKEHRPRIRGAQRYVDDARIIHGVEDEGHLQDLAPVEVAHCDRRARAGVVEGAAPTSRVRFPAFCQSC